MVVAIFLSAGVLLIAGSVLLLVGKTNSFVHYSADEEANVRALSSSLPLYLGQAVNIDWTDTTITNINGGRGRLLNFTSSFNPTPLPPIAIGIFLREAGIPNSTIPTSDLRATGLYFRNPTTLTEGELIISSATSGTGNVTVSSDQVSQSFKSIVGLEVSPGGFPSVSGDPVRVVKVKITYRKFLSTDKNEWRWCPEANKLGPNCQTSARYQDIEHILHIPLPNNAIPTNFTRPDGSQRNETLFGDLYFFRLFQGAK